MIELRHMAVFVTLAEECHFARAAMRLGITQPRLSMLLRRLEDLLGARLVDRRPKFRLTEEGDAALPHFKAALRRMEAGVDLVHRRRDGFEGRLRVGFPTWLLATAIPDYLVQFRQVYPDVWVELLDLGTEAQIDQVRSGALDVGFVRARPFADGEIGLYPLFTDPWRVVLPADHPLAAETDVQLDHLRDEPVVSFPERFAPQLHAEVVNIWAASGLAPQVMHEAGEWLAIVGLVRAGAGWALVPASIEKLYSNGLAYRAVSGGEPFESSVCGALATAPRPVARLFWNMINGTP